MKIDIAKARTILGPFKKVPTEHVDPALLKKVTDYKQRIAARFVSISKDEINKRVAGSNFHVSLKLDGEHVQLFYEGEEAYLVRHRGYVFYGLPCLEEAARILKKAGVKSCLIPGELHARVPDRRCRVTDVVSLTNVPESAAALETLEFAPFDIVELNGETFDNHAAIQERLMALFEGTRLSPPRHVTGASRADIARLYDEWVVKEGHEGLMIKSDLPFRYKLKAAHSFDAVIVGYTSEDEMVSNLLVALVREDGRLLLLAKIFRGLTEEQRREMNERLKGTEIDSEYLDVDSHYRPFRMVAPRTVIEFTAGDIATEHASGRPYVSMLLEIENDTWKVVKQLPFVGMLHNDFVRIREDKTPNSSDCRLAQVTDLVFIEDEEPRHERRELPDPQILLRDVYVKELVGKPAVRKIIVWKTNREELDSDYPAYIVNYTDFSPNRAEPLKQDICISSSARQIFTMAEDFRKENITKGWEAVASGRIEFDVTSLGLERPEPDAEPTPRASKKVTKKAAKKVTKKAAKKATKKT